MVALTILITENIFLLLFLLIWINRECKKCGQVKCLERLFNKWCRECQKKLLLKKYQEQKAKKEEVEL